MLRVSSPEKENTVVLGCNCCFSTSVSWETSCHEASSTGLVKTPQQQQNNAKRSNPPDFERSRCLQPSGHNIPSYRQKGASKTHTSPRGLITPEIPVEKNHPETNPLGPGPFAWWRGRSPKPAHSQTLVSSLLGTRTVQQLLWLAASAPFSNDQLPKPVEKKASGRGNSSDPWPLQHSQSCTLFCCQLQEHLRASEHIPRSAAARYSQSQH